MTPSSPQPAYTPPLQSWQSWVESVRISYNKDDGPHVIIRMHGGASPELQRNFVAALNNTAAKGNSKFKPAGSSDRFRSVNIRFGTFAEAEQSIGRLNACGLETRELSDDLQQFKPKHDEWANLPLLKRLATKKPAMQETEFKPAMASKYITGDPNRLKSGSERDSRGGRG